MNEGVMSRRWGAKGLARGCLVTGDRGHPRPGCQPGLWQQKRQKSSGSSQVSAEAGSPVHHLAAISVLWVDKEQSGEGEEVGGEEPTSGLSIPATSQNLPPGPWGPQTPTLAFPSRPHPRHQGIAGLGRLTHWGPRASGR